MTIRSRLVIRILGLTHRLAYATTVALAGFLLTVMPVGLRIDPSGFVVHLLDLPVAAAGLLLAPEWRGIDLWFQPQEWGYLHPIEGLLRHLRLAIPVYMLLFYLPNLIAGAHRRLRPQGVKKAEPTP